MQRRNLLIGMGSIAAGGAATIGTGAFTSVEADRSVDVNVSDDAGAYLRLEGNGGENSEYVTQNGDGNQLAIDLTDSNDNFPGSTDPNGVNPDAVTQINDLLLSKTRGHKKSTSVSAKLVTLGTPVSLASTQTLLSRRRGDTTPPMAIRCNWVPVLRRLVPEIPSMSAWKSTLKILVFRQELKSWTA